MFKKCIDRRTILLIKLVELFTCINMNYFTNEMNIIHIVELFTCI